MLQYMLDTNICIYVIKNYPPRLRERFNRLAEQLCISSVTLAELHYGAEKSVRCLENLQAIEQFCTPRISARFARTSSVSARRWGRSIC
jgi:tRNA(fMet)-specific endonuclease VapC